MEETWFVFTTLGDMNLSEVINECQQKGWAPILYLEQHDGQIIVPCFKNSENAITFCRRNLPKNHLFGSTALSAKDVEIINKDWVEGLGYKLQLMDFPRRIKDLEKFNVEIYHFFEKPDIYAVEGKQTYQQVPLSVLDPA